MCAFLGRAGCVRIGETPRKLCDGAPRWDSGPTTTIREGEGLVLYITVCNIYTLLYITYRLVLRETLKLLHRRVKFMGSRQDWETQEQKKLA